MSRPTPKFGRSRRLYDYDRNAGSQFRPGVTTPLRQTGTRAWSPETADFSVGPDYRDYRPRQISRPATPQRRD